MRTEMAAMRTLSPLSARILRKSCCIQELLGYVKYYSGVRNYCSQASTDVTDVPDFGLFFDIDGVIRRGRQTLPDARQAFKQLTRNGEFLVPTVFVTNAGNVKRYTRAKQLSEWLDIHVAEDQVIMSHSPLKMYRQFWDKHVLVCGQGPTLEIASGLGFKNVTTIETLRHCFPMLDTVDHRRRKTAPCAFEKYFPRIEVLILFGEPVRWETNLQLIIDVLLSNGQPSETPSAIVYPHMPVLACNMDLFWMAEACMPRFAHGSFLHCLESLYQKISGHELKYTALVGKPSEITYIHSEDVLQRQAQRMGLPGIRTMYCIGDNPDVDIYGANLFGRLLQKRLEKRVTSLQLDASGHVVDDARTKRPPPEGADEGRRDLENVHSVLVCTGVYSRNRDYSEQNKKLLLDHNHRDFIMDADLKKPCLTVTNVLEAVNVILDREIGRASCRERVYAPV